MSYETQWHVLALLCFFLAMWLMAAHWSDEE